MAPILASAAVSLAGQIFHNLTTKAPTASAQSAAASAGGVKFSALLDGATSAAAARQHTVGLTERLAKCSEVAAAINQSGASGPLQIQIERNGDAALRAADGTLTPLHLSEEMKSVARELSQSRALGLPPSAAGQKPAPLLVSIA